MFKTFTIMIAHCHYQENFFLLRENNPTLVDYVIYDYGDLI